MSQSTGRSSAPIPDGLKIAMVSTSRIFGGAESQFAVLARGLRQRGHACHLLVRRGSPLEELARAERFPVRTFRGTCRSPGSMGRTRSFLSSWRPDVLYMNDAHAVTGGGLSAWRLAVPVRVAARRSIYAIRRPGRYARLVDRVVCVSRAVADACHEAGLPAGLLRVVHDGLPIGPVDRSARRDVRHELGLSLGAPLLLTVAMLHSQKGHCDLLDALPRIVDRYPDIVVALAGSGPERGALEQRARDLSVHRNVRFLGFRHDVARLTRAADLFVMPSRSEGLCSSLIAAMHAECPVVTTTAGGIGELFAPHAIEGPPMAWTVPPRDPKALARAVLESLDRPGDRAARAARARETATGRFTDETMVERTLEVYREVLDRHTRERPVPSGARPVGSLLRLPRPQASA